MNYTDTTNWMFNKFPMYQKVGAAAYKPDLHNTIELLEYLNNPQENFKTIHVAGTNGKGTVSHSLASVLQECGYKTGLYTSPHLRDFRERIRINGEMISEQDVINEIDMKDQRKNVVLSRSQAKELSKDYRSLVGKNVKISNLNFQVVGIYKDDESRNNTDAFIAYSTIKTIYAKGDDAGSLEFTIKNLKTKEDNEKFEKNYRASINNNHQAAPDDERTIWLWNRYMDNIQMNQGIAIMQTALWIVGLFTLLSGIVGVSNIMLITVKERTREFGVRKAIGAKPWSILKLIITESIIITSFFGYIGMVCGVAANEIMDATIGHTTVDTGLFKAAMFVNPTVGIGTCIGATITIVIAGTIAGLIPAIKAARIRPIEALRAE